MYNDENDYELLYLISESSEEAKEVFFEKYKPTIQTLVLKYFPLIKNKGYEINDLYQEGMVGLSQAINDYREQKNVQFNTFAAVCIERQILSFIRNVSRNKHRVLNESISIDTTVNSVGRNFIDTMADSEIVNPENSFINIEEAEQILKEIKEVLTDKEYEVYTLRAKGFTYQEIASLLNITTKSVDGAISRIKTKINNIKRID